MKIRFALSLFALAAFPLLMSAQLKPMSWNVNGTTRHALVAIPADNSSPAPLVFVFHGHGGNMNGFAQHTVIHERWPKAIVVYPQGLDTESRLDPQGKKPGWQKDPGQDGDRDLKFFDTMLADLSSKYSVDANRVYTMGFSNGAFFSYLLWSARADKLAAIASVAGRISPDARPSTPKPIVLVAGRRDPLVKLDDTKATVEEVLKLDSAGKGESCGTDCFFHASPTKTPVMVRYHDGGHMYPPWASDVIVQFFQRHERH